MNKTILKWPGSKAKVMGELNKHLPAGNRLVEPFAGSCAVMMNTDYPAYLVADINPELINLYRQIQEFEKPFTALAASVFAQNADEESYYSIRKSFNDDAGMTLIYRAAYFLYLTRHAYRGLCRFNQSGGFNAPYEKTAKPYFPTEEIQAFAIKAKRATFICADFTETLAQVEAGDVVYCDPPYDGTFTQYHTNAFAEIHQRQLAQQLNELAAAGVPVVASNSETSLIKNLYGEFDRHIISAPRSIGVAAGKSKKASEIIAVSRPANKGEVAA
ncbi:DNA adenine methylase [Pantoea sp. NPDC088449]|uniref:DNA adenine methylase n=1 Tax=Pantoea sp. NPDC088449 TaxID=3364392 RepID=UPI00380A66DB